MRTLQAKQLQERCRVLQDALHALAQEHHELERSIVSPFHSSPNFPHYEDTDCDEFFDAFEGGKSFMEFNIFLPIILPYLLIALLDIYYITFFYCISLHIFHISFFFK